VRELAEIFVEGLVRRYPELPLKEDPVELVEFPAPRPSRVKYLLLLRLVVFATLILILLRVE